MTVKPITQDGILDPSLVMRHANWDDLSAVTQLIYDVCEADGDTSVAQTEDEMKVEWQTPGFNLETDALVVMTPEGRIVGYQEFTNESGHTKLRLDGYAHPDFKGKGILRATMLFLEERARKEIDLADSGARVYIQSTLDSKDEEAISDHEALGYKTVRHIWRKQIDLENAPPQVKFPKGLELRPFVRGEHDRAVWSAVQESFRDHWGTHETPLDEWASHKFGRVDFDPSLWMIAWDGDQIAGVCLNRYRMGGIGWVGSLGVRRPWRKLGLGYALLVHSFGEFYNRGTKSIGLSVDSQNPTGATRLYDKAGMYTVSEFVTYEKELRSGRESERHE